MIGEKAKVVTLGTDGDLGSAGAVLEVECKFTGYPGPRLRSESNRHQQELSRRCFAEQENRGPSPRCDELV
jgi:hypothetical protein